MSSHAPRARCASHALHAPAPSLHRLARLVTLLAALAWATPGAAQASRVIAVSALVGDPVTVTVLQPLAFTTVFPGVAKVVSPLTGGTAGATAGTFRLQGRPGAEVEMYLSFPTALAAGANALVIDSWSACVNTVDTPTGCTAFVPSSTGNTARLNGPGTPPAGRLFVRLGATVRPVATQPAGTYTGTMTLSAVYTGF